MNFILFQVQTYHPGVVVQRLVNPGALGREYLPVELGAD